MLSRKAVRVLGVHDGHDAGVVLLEDGHVVYAANEERFSRKKFHWGFPHLSLQNLFATTKIAPESIDAVAVSGQSKFERDEAMAFALEPSHVNVYKRYGGAIARVLGPVTETAAFASFVKGIGMVQRERRTVRQYLRAEGIHAPTRFFDHHACHAASAYFTAGTDPVLVVTADFSGDGVSGSVSIGREGVLTRIAQSPVVHSAGRFWDVITILCGFKPTRHAGKITGLAAYRPSPEAYRELRKLYGANPAALRFENRERRVWFGEFARVRELLPFASREELAYAAQKVLEEAFITVVQAAIARTGIQDVALAGGTFANVRLNQQLAELPEVESLHIFPNMGDGGLAMGAAFLETSKVLPLRPHSLPHLYWGPSYTAEDIRRVAETYHVPLEPLSDPAGTIAQTLAQKRVVGVYEGRMEYGPRALGHRSILAEPTDPTMMDWLNKRLERTEFMPFAPMILEEAAQEYFHFPSDKLPHALEHMTICVDVTEEGKRKAPGIVHKDGTARPQTISRREQPLLHRALTRYEALTGLPLCINTSFNKHEEPIVCTPGDVLTEFRRGGVDVLVMEGFAARFPVGASAAKVRTAAAVHAGP